MLKELQRERASGEGRATQVPFPLSLWMSTASKSETVDKHTGMGGCVLGQQEKSHVTVVEILEGKLEYAWASQRKVSAALCRCFMTPLPGIFFSG